MTLFRINNTKIKINFMIIMLCAVWFFAGQIQTFFIMTVAVMIHELSHAFIARLFGFHTESIELFPFGGAADIRGIEDNYTKEAIVASAGPLISLFAGFVWEEICRGMSRSPDEFVGFSYNIAMVNLLPVYPLDGGRILMCTLKEIFGDNKGRKRAVCVGIIISSLFFIKSLLNVVFYKNTEEIFMACFMLTASLKAIKKPQGISLREKYWKNENVRFIKLYGYQKITDVLTNFNGNYFYYVFVVDEKENTLSVLSEKQIFEWALKDSTLILKDITVKVPGL